MSLSWFNCKLPLGFEQPNCTHHVYYRVYQGPGLGFLISIEKFGIVFLDCISATMQLDLSLTLLSFSSSSKQILQLLHYMVLNSLIKQVQEDASSAQAGKMTMNSLTERALSPPGSGGLFSSNKTASAFVAGSEAYPVNKALTAVSASQRPASPMGMAILKGQFLD